MKTIKKKLILLDLDNTVICSEDLDSVKDSGKIEKARQKFGHIRMIDYYDIFERPHLEEFLDYIFQHFAVGIWTASSKDYASFVTQHCIVKNKNRPIELFLCSHHCNVSKRNFKIAKDLKLISDKWNLKKFEDLILIDDLEELAKHQPNNVISVKPFFYDDEKAYNDDELLKVKTKLESLK